VFSVIEDRDACRLTKNHSTGGQRVFAVSQGHPSCTMLEGESVLFSFSACIVQQKLCICREGRGNV
jgi:hypothetical protein